VDLTAPERALRDAFPRGDLVDLTGAADRTVRAEVISSLLLGAGRHEPGKIAGIRLEGARITGELRLAYARIAGPVRLGGCEFDQRIDLYAARLRHLSLQDSRLAGLQASRARFDGNLRMTAARCDGQVRLTGAHITGALQLQRATLSRPGDVAVLANQLVVGDDLLAQKANIEGGFQVSGARIGGMFGLDGAVIANPRGRALNAFNLTVEAVLWARHGFTATGEVAISGANIGREVSLIGASLRNPGAQALVARQLKVGTLLLFGTGFSSQGEIVLSGAEVRGIINLRGSRLSNPGGDALRCRHARATEIVLEMESVAGTLDLRHARFDVIRDDEARWPAAMRISGLRYETLNPPLPAARRVAWLDRDPGGYQPENYETLAAMYRRLGDDAGARMVLLARERRRRHLLPWYSRAWSWLQEITVGYGYRPLRAAAWLAAFAAAGTLVFALHHPPPLSGAGVPAFNPLIYTVDLMVPFADLGLRGGYDPQGAQRWVAYALMAVGWVFVSTIAAGIMRVLRRE
jgi:uncharacterized protein YjbI with pentapeptide repeats